MKAYALLAAVITMTITSAGAAGYLSGEFQKAIMGTQEVSLKVDVLKAEQARLEERKNQIDAGIAAIPDRYTANQKIRLMNQFKAEQKQVTDRLNELSRQLPEMQIAQIGVEAKAGPILYIAKAFDITVEEAVKWVILMIIFVFDPLAVFLIIAGNFLLHQRKLSKDTNVADADLFEQLPSTPDRSDNWDSYTGFTVEPVRKEPNAQTVAAMKEARELVADRSASFLPVAKAPPAPLYQIAEPVQQDTPVDDGTEVQVASPADSQILPTYIAEADTEVSTATPPESTVLPMYVATSQPPEEPRAADYQEPEAITLSTLGMVRPDPATITDVQGPVNGDDYEVGLGTGVFKTGAPRR